MPALVLAVLTQISRLAMSLPIAILPCAQLSHLRTALLENAEHTPLSKRFRALFALRAIASDDAISIISQALLSNPSPLLGHELAYVLGQIGHPSALQVLSSVLADFSIHPMVRHEAAESIGAIGQLDSIPTLQKYLNDPEISVSETCQLAINRIRHDTSLPDPNNFTRTGQYGTVDPAPSMLSSITPKSIPLNILEIHQMRNVLLDPTVHLFERYRAMFGLRDAVGRALESPQNNPDEIVIQAIETLAAGFGDASALFRHEIAYVFGQLCHPASVPFLLQVLRNKSEEEMVRHEAAEALGSIATPDVMAVLQEFAGPHESSRIVRQSCEVALDMYEYAHSNEFQYATPF